MSTKSFLYPLTLTPAELQQILGQCRHIVVTPAPEFDLRNYLVNRLRKAWPDTARKVAEMDEEQLETLCWEIANYQAWTW